MRYPEELKSVIKRMEAVLLDGICRADPVYRKMAISRLSKINYESLDFETGKNKFGLSQYNPAMYDPVEKKISIIRESIKTEILEPVLIHEMCHAVSADNDKVGFSRFGLYDMKSEKLRPATSEDLSNNNCLFLVENNDYAFNEAANEFFASSFYGEKPVAYIPFLPVFSVIANVCGYKETLNYFFANDFEGLIELAKEKFHLENDYPIRFLSQKMTSAYSNNGIDEFEAGDCLDLIMDIYANKLIKENAGIKEFDDLKKIANISEVFGFKKIFGEDIDVLTKSYSEAVYNKFCHGVDLYKDVDLLNLKTQFFNRISHILKTEKCEDLEEQTILSANLPNVILLFNQKFACFIGDGMVADHFISHAFLESLTNENGKLNLNNFSQKDKNYIIKSLVNKKSFDFGDSYKFINTDDLSKYLSNCSVKDVKQDVWVYIAAEITRNQDIEEESHNLSNDLNINEKK